MGRDEITSIAELKKRVDFWANEDKNVMPSEKASLQWVLVLINEFEANVKERLEECEQIHKTASAYELSRVLGKEIKGDEKSG